MKTIRKHIDPPIMSMFILINLQTYPAKQCKSTKTTEGHDREYLDTWGLDGLPGALLESSHHRLASIQHIINLSTWLVTWWQQVKKVTLAVQQQQSNQNKN